MSVPAPARVPAEPSSAGQRPATTAAKIKELILSRGLRPGDLMPTETELCDTLQVSRTSIREAIRNLAALDIVNVRHGHGTFVGNVSLDPMVEALVFRGTMLAGEDLQVLREVVEIRRALDLAMADDVIATHQGTHDTHLADLVSTMVRLAQAGQRFLAPDRDFHTLLLSRLNNRLAGQLVGAFWDIHTAVLPRLGLALPADLRRTASAHGDMLRAAQAGDVAAYRAAVIDHYEPLQRALKSQ